MILSVTVCVEADSHTAILGLLATEKNNRESSEGEQRLLCIQSQIFASLVIQQTPVRIIDQAHLWLLLGHCREKPFCI